MTQVQIPRLHLIYKKSKQFPLESILTFQYFAENLKLRATTSKLVQDEKCCTMGYGVVQHGRVYMHLFLYHVERVSCLIVSLIYLEKHYAASAFSK